MRISDWSSDVCSSDLKAESPRKIVRTIFRLLRNHRESKGLERAARSWKADKRRSLRRRCTLCSAPVWRPFRTLRLARRRCNGTTVASSRRSEEHTSELQSLMRTSYAVFGLKKKKTTTQ